MSISTVTMMKRIAAAGCCDAGSAGLEGNGFKARGSMDGPGR